MNPKIVTFCTIWIVQATQNRIDLSNAINKAKKLKAEIKKPILNAGCGYTDFGDINLDINYYPVRNFMQGDIQNLKQFKDKMFSVAVSSHVLEHVDNPEKALKELNRVAHKVIAIVPKPYELGAWFYPTHKWVFINGQKIKINTMINDLLLVLALK